MPQTTNARAMPSRTAKAPSETTRAETKLLDHKRSRTPWCPLWRAKPVPGWHAWKTRRTGEVVTDVRPHPVGPAGAIFEACNDMWLFHVAGERRGVCLQAVLQAQKMLVIPCALLLDPWVESSSAISPRQRKSIIDLPPSMILP